MFRSLYSTNQNILYFFTSVYSSPLERNEYDSYTTTTSSTKDEPRGRVTILSLDQYEKVRCGTRKTREDLKKILSLGRDSVVSVALCKRRIRVRRSRRTSRRGNQRRTKTHFGRMKSAGMQSMRMFNCCSSTRNSKSALSFHKEQRNNGFSDSSSKTSANNRERLQHHDGKYNYYTAPPAAASMKNSKK